MENQQENQNLSSQNNNIQSHDKSRHKQNSSPKNDSDNGKKDNHNQKNQKETNRTSDNNELHLTYIRLEYNKLIEIYKYSPEIDIENNRFYIVETKHGLEIGKIVGKAIPLNTSELPDRILSVVRPANLDDFEIQQANKAREKNTFIAAKEKISKHKLPIKLIDVHHFYEGNKILFNFSAEGRVDFRELVRDLAATFRTRIELRQIGVRDESMVLGGYGVCGRELCCTTLHTNTESISIKMAKEQNLTLNSMKISGICGRLMCCLDYEYCIYRDIKKEFPEIGSEIHVNGNLTTVREINVQNEKIFLVSTDDRPIVITLHDYKKCKRTNGKVEIKI